MNSRHRRQGHRQPVHQVYCVACKAHPISENFNSSRDSIAQSPTINGVDFVRRPEAAAVGAADKEENHGPFTGAPDGRQLLQVLGAPGADGVGKGCGWDQAAFITLAFINTQSRILDLHPTGGARIPIAGREPKIDPAAFLGTVENLGPHLLIPLKLGNPVGFDQGPDHPVGAPRVDPDPGAAHADHLQGVTQLAFRILGVGDQNGTPRFAARRHAAGVRAVDRQPAAVGKLHVGEETLVAQDQGSFDQRAFDLHLFG